MIAPIITGGYGGYEVGNSKFADVDWSKNQHIIEFEVISLKLDFSLNTHSLDVERVKHEMFFDVLFKTVSFGAISHSIDFMSAEGICNASDLNTFTDNDVLVTDGKFSLTFIPINIVEIYVNELGVIDNHDDLVVDKSTNTITLNTHELDGYSIDIKYQYK